jgi:hypothetical protein
VFSGLVQSFNDFMDERDSHEEAETQYSVVSLIGVQYFIVAFAWFGRSQVNLKAFSDPPFV